MSLKFKCVTSSFLENCNCKPNADFSKAINTKQAHHTSAKRVDDNMSLHSMPTFISSTRQALLQSGTARQTDLATSSVQVGASVIKICRQTHKTNEYLSQATRKDFCLSGRHISHLALKKSSTRTSSI